MSMGLPVVTYAHPDVLEVIDESVGYLAALEVEEAAVKSENENDSGSESGSGSEKDSESESEDNREVENVRENLHDGHQGSDNDNFHSQEKERLKENLCVSLDLRGIFCNLFLFSIIDEMQ
jgi:hypothetical protein